MSRTKKKQRGRGNHRADFSTRLELVRNAAEEMGFTTTLVASDQLELNQLAHRTGLNSAQVKRALIELNMWEPDDEHKKVPRRGGSCGCRS